jgi:hypothetical protein
MADNLGFPKGTKLPVRGSNVTINFTVSGVIMNIFEPEKWSAKPIWEEITRAPINQGQKEITDARIKKWELKFEGQRIHNLLSKVVDDVEQLHNGGDALLPEDMVIDIVITDPESGAEQETQTFTRINLKEYEEGNDSLNDGLKETVEFFAENRVAIAA